LADDGEEGAAYALTDAGAPFRDRLVREMKRRLRELRRHVGMDGWPGPVDETGAAETTAKWLAETFPTEGAAVAEELRRRADADPWAPWEPKGEDFAFILRRLVRLVWRNGMEAEAERARRNRPALPRCTAVDVSDMASPHVLYLPGLDDGLIRTRSGRHVRATIMGGLMDAERVRDGLALMPSMAFHRLIRTLVHSAYDQAEDGVEDYRILAFDGGWSGLTDRLDLSAKHRKDVRLIAETGARIEWKMAGRQGIALWTLDAPDPENERVAHRGRKADAVLFTLGTMLLPYAGRSMKQAVKRTRVIGADPANWRLVPELRHDPPMTANSEQAQVYTMARRFMVLMVDRAVELAESGGRGLLLADAEWEELASKSGLGKARGARVRNKWLEGDGADRPPLIEEVDGLIRLSTTTYQVEHDFIVEGGRVRAKADTKKRAEHRRKGREGR
jgi:hypothetical protein